jgi:hypothetical protein
MAKIARNDVGGTVAKDVIVGHKEGTQLRSQEDRDGNSIDRPGKPNTRNVPAKVIEDLSVAMIAGRAGADRNDTENVITNRIVSPSQTNRCLPLP